MDRVNRVISTPLSLQKRISRIPIRNEINLNGRTLFSDITEGELHNGLVKNTDLGTPNRTYVVPATPTSILKSDKKKRLPPSGIFKF